MNEDKQLAQRQGIFHLPALLDVAAKVVGVNRKCTQALKYREGHFNKAFLVTMDNGAEIVAKIPNPNAGPQKWTTLSEVATVDFLRSVVGIPMPRVLQWSSDIANTVGSEYIIMEKAPGTLLGDVWKQLSRPSQNKVIKQVIAIEQKLAAITFRGHGCLYYSRDVPSSLSVPMPILENTLETASGPFQERFCVGPSVDRDLWQDERANNESKKGPWASFLDYTLDIGWNELSWAKSYAKPRMNFYRAIDAPEPPSEYIELLERYLLVAPYLVRGFGDTSYQYATESKGKELEEAFSPTLWHPDLHLNNVFIDIDTDQITSIIDWQSTAVAPLILQAKIPRMVRHNTDSLPPGWELPTRPPDYDNLPEDERIASSLKMKSKFNHKYYEVLNSQLNQRHFNALKQSAFLEDRLQPIRDVVGAWHDRSGIFKLRTSLITSIDNWGTLMRDVGGTENCPISFSDHERMLHKEECERLGAIEDLVEGLQRNGILPADGMVDPEDYDYLQEINQAQKQAFIAQLPGKEERELADKIWPYQDDVN